MSLIPLPTATIDDSDVECVLARAVGVINPVLDLLAGVDLLGLKRRTHALGSSDATTAKVLDAAAWVLIAVAFPGAFGVVADRLPVQDVLGFVNQSIVLCAVARELGVTDRRQQVRLLGAVMCDRDLDPGGLDEADTSEVGVVLGGWTPTGLGKAVWHLAGLMRAIGAELVKRPHPRSVFRYLGMLPAAGAVADYLGEYGALVRASEEGRQWIAGHAGAVGA